MIRKNSESGILGIAFLIQGIAAMISEAVLFNPLIVPGNIHESLLNIENNAWRVNANILSEMITALGIVFLGVMLYRVLKKENEKIALTALGFYILEAAVLAVSRISTFSLLQISRNYVSTGYPEYLKTMGELALESMSYGYTLHLLPFCCGAVLFYYLLYKSKVVPSFFSLWGLITVLPFLIGTPAAMFGYKVPIFIYLPYVPFEYIIGIWLLVKGLKEKKSVENKKVTGTIPAE